MKWVWESFLGLLQAPTLRAASKCLEQLSAARAQSCEHRAGWRPLPGGLAVLGTLTGGLQRLGKLGVHGRSTGSSLTHEARQTIGPIKYLQALDFVLNFCVKLNSHEKARPTGWVGRRQSKASIAQAAASILASASPPAKPNMFQAQVLAEKKLLIKPDYAKLCGVFSMWTEVHWGLSWDHQTLFIPDPGVRLERRSAEAALADCSLSSSLSFSQGLYFKVVESAGFYDVGSWVYSFVFTV